jgi:hypothetical protein
LNESERVAECGEMVLIIGLNTEEYHTLSVLAGRLPRSLSKAKRYKLIDDQKLTPAKSLPKGK